MSETNGTAPDAKRILSLETARATKTRKGNDFITVQQAHDMVIQECAKVHEHYLEQIPNYMARMIQDALLHYELIKPLPGTDIAPAGSSEATGIGIDNTAVPQSGDAASNPGEPPTLTPAEPPAEPAA